MRAHWSKGRPSDGLTYFSTVKAEAVHGKNLPLQKRIERVAVRLEELPAQAKTDPVAEWLLKLSESLNVELRDEQPEKVKATA